MVTPSTSIEEMISSGAVENTYVPSYHSHYEEDVLPQSQGRQTTIFSFEFE